MNQKVALAIIFLALAILSIIHLTQEQKICFEETCFKVEIADTPSEREIGLMHREFMPENEGMFFIFEESAVYPFWMKNTLIPLDILWMDENFKVVHIVTATPCESDPCQTYDPKVEAKYVLEVNAGLSQRYGINVGDKFSRS